MAPKKPTSTQNTTLQTMGMDVIKQYPGPLTVSNSPDPHRAPTLCRFGCAILGSARPPTHPPPTRSMTSTCRCSNAPVFSRTRHMLL